MMHSFLRQVTQVRHLLVFHVKVIILDQLEVVWLALTITT